MTVWNRFYLIFIILIKNITEEAKLFNPPRVYSHPINKSHGVQSI